MNATQSQPKLETNNRELGFYGTAFRIAQLTDRQCEKLYSEAANKVADYYCLTPSQVVQFLDGKDGRHLADDIVTEEGTMDSFPGWLTEAIGAFLADTASKAPAKAADPPRTRQASIPALCGVLSKVLSTTEVAGILNALMSCEAEPSLSDAEADLGGAIFDQLCLLRPEAVAVAQGQ